MQQPLQWVYDPDDSQYYLLQQEVVNKLGTDNIRYLPVVTPDGPKQVLSFGRSGGTDGRGTQVRRLPVQAFARRPVPGKGTNFLSPYKD